MWHVYVYGWCTQVAQRVNAIWFCGYNHFEEKKICLRNIETEGFHIMGSIITIMEDCYVESKHNTMFGV